MVYKFGRPVSSSHGSLSDAAGQLRKELARRADEIERIGSDSDPILTDIPASNRHFVAEGSDAWKAWQQVKSSPCSATVIDGQHCRGWWFPAPLPSDEPLPVPSSVSSPRDVPHVRPSADSRPVVNSARNFVQLRDQWIKQLRVDRDLGAGSLRLGERVAYEYLHKDGDSLDYFKAWPGNAALVTFLGCTVKTFRAWRQQLEDRGHWKVTPAKGKGDRTIYAPIFKSAAQNEPREQTPPEVDDSAFEIDTADDMPTAVAATETTAPRPATLPGPIFTPPRGDVAYPVRRSPDAMRAGASAVTFLTPDAEQAERERQRARNDRDWYRQRGMPIDEAEKTAAMPMSPDAMIRLVMDRMRTQVPMFDPGPSFEGSGGSIGDSCLPAVKDRSW